ncbi:MAG: hypothetical protein CSA33_04445 [Desulfobulbus propionicus]|nr:MAG: hypothetical protein CSA33_04445 [Desulfobulbus propionicus]
MDATTHVSYYPNFDWLRLMLATEVVAIHSNAAPSVFINPVPGFLAISGFVVLGSIERRTPGAFFLSRALRILPLLFASFLAVGILYSPAEMLYNIRFWIWPKGAPPPNPVVWTLLYEEVFYALLVILFVSGLYKKKILPVLLCSIVITLTLSRNFFLLQKTWYTLGSAFFTGNVIYLFRGLISKYINSILATALFVLAVAAVYSNPYTDITPNSEAYVDLLSYAAMLIFAISGPQLPKVHLDISYSIYLIHCLVLAQLVYFIKPGTRLFVFTLLSTISISFASWYLIERPMIGLKTKILQIRTAPSKKRRAMPTGMPKAEPPQALRLLLYNSWLSRKKK